MKWENINQLCDVVRETSFAIHRYHRNGHLEKIYENALVNRLRKQGVKVEQQFPLTVYDEDGTILGEYFADLFIEGCLIVELKAVKATADEHIAQILGYLKSSRIEVPDDTKGIATRLTRRDVFLCVFVLFVAIEWAHARDKLCESPVAQPFLNALSEVAPSISQNLSTSVNKRRYGDRCATQFGITPLPVLRWADRRRR